MIILVFSCFASVFNSVSPFVLGVPDKVVSNETELKDTINNAPSKTSVVVAFNNDISLSFTLSIPANKNITLISNSKDNDNCFKLFGASDQKTIIVEDSGVLLLEGIIVTHVESSYATGVLVNPGGTLILSGGEISGNDGSGVWNHGNFRMLGGKIFGNSNSNGHTTFSHEGGGVCNTGTFTMFDGEISGNSVTGYYGSRGGGVYNSGTFNLSGGIISNNRAMFGGGVSNGGNFTMSGGEISGNTDGGGVRNGGNLMHFGGNFSMFSGKISGNTDGGVINCEDFIFYGGEISNNDGSGVVNELNGDFRMAGGKISNNTYGGNGGGVSNGGNFTMSGGEISGNTAVNDFGSYFGNGGGVAINGDGVFSMSDGEISSNRAVNGGGVYLGDPYDDFNGVFRLSGGKIFGNTASNSGGGIWVDVKNLGNLFVSDGVMFSNNAASVAYNRDPVHDNLYKSHIEGGVTWTAPFTQGYNNYDISYTSGTPITNHNQVEIIVICVIFVVITSIVALLLMLSFRKRKRGVTGDVSNVNYSSDNYPPNRFRKQKVLI